MCLLELRVCVKIVSAAHSHGITRADYLFSFFTCHCVCKTLACCFVLAAALHLASGSQKLQAAAHFQSEYWNTNIYLQTKLTPKDSVPQEAATIFKNSKN